MSFIDRIRELFGGKKSGAESTAVMGGSTAATSRDDPEGDVEPSPSDSGSGWRGGGESGGDRGDGTA